MFCFILNIITLGYPTSVTLSGDIEMSTPKACQSCLLYPDYYNQAPYTNSNLTVSFSGVPLGISLVDFGGEQERSLNKLWWTTMNEVDNDYFILDKSVNGTTWIQLGVVYEKGSGTYTFTDYHVPLTINYYRLTQVDVDGTKTVLKTVAIDNSQKKFEVVKRYNLAGEEVDEYYRGVVLEKYKDGSILKIVR